MDSIFSSYSKVDRDEKMSLQILISPVDGSLHKKMRESIDDIKEGKKKDFWTRIEYIRKNIIKGAVGDTKETKNHEFSSQQQ